MEYGLGPAPVTREELAEMRADLERLEGEVAQENAAARFENQLGLRMFSERDALDLLDLLRSSPAKSPFYDHVDPLIVLRRQNAQAEAAADTTKLLELNDAWLCAHAVQRIMDCFCRDANSVMHLVDDPEWRPALEAANTMTAIIAEGLADGKQTLTEIFGPDSPEGLEEQGWAKYAFDDWPDREDAPTTTYAAPGRRVLDVDHYLIGAKRRFGEANVKVVPAQDFFRRPIEDGVHIYVRPGDF